MPHRVTVTGARRSARVGGGDVPDGRQGVTRVGPGRSVDNGFRSTRSQRVPGRPEGHRAPIRRRRTRTPVRDPRTRAGTHIRTVTRPDQARSSQTRPGQKARPDRTGSGRDRTGPGSDRDQMGPRSGRFGMRGGPSPGRPSLVVRPGCASRSSVPGVRPRRSSRLFVPVIRPGRSCRAAGRRKGPSQKRPAKKCPSARSAGPGEAPGRGAPAGRSARPGRAFLPRSCRIDTTGGPW